MEDRSQSGTQPTQIAIRIMWMIVASIVAIQSSMAQDATVSLDSPWIWSPRGNAASETYFRKKFTLVKPETAELIVAACDEFELFINGRMVVSGQSYRSVMSVDAIDFLNPGVNVVAVKANHIDSDSPGFSCKIRVKEKGENRHRVLKTDATWRSYTAEAVDWYKNGFRDMSWLSSKVVASVAPKTVTTVMPNTENPGVPSVEVAAKELSSKIELVSQAPPVPIGFNQDPVVKKDFVAGPVTQSSEPKVALQTAQTNPVGNDNRFVTAGKDFSVTEVLPGDLTGSVIAMEFNEFGKLLLSREGGPLLISDLSRNQGDETHLQIYCDEVTSCQGILPLNGDVFVTAEGPESLSETAVS